MQIKLYFWPHIHEHHIYVYHIANTIIFLYGICFTSVSRYMVKCSFLRLCLYPHSVLCSSWRTRTFPVALSHISQVCVYQLGFVAQHRHGRQINVVVCLWYQEQKLSDPCAIGQISTSCDWYWTELDIQVCVRYPRFWLPDAVLTIELDTTRLHLFLLAKYEDTSVK